MRSLGPLTATAAMMAMAAAASHPSDEIAIRGEPLPDRRRRPKRDYTAPAGSLAPRAAQFVGDGFDAERIERAEMKRARRAQLRQARS